MAKKKFTISKDLHRDTQAYLRKVLLQLGDSLEDVDTGVLTLLSSSYDTYVRANEQISVDGLTQRNRFGDLISHPLLRVASSSHKQALDCMKELGLTIKARKHLNPLEGDDELTDFEKFLTQK